MVKNLGKKIIIFTLIQLLIIGGAFGGGYWKRGQRASQESSKEFERFETELSELRTELKGSIELSERLAESDCKKQELVDGIGFEIEKCFEESRRATSTIQQLESYIFTFGRIFESIQEMEQETDSRIDNNTDYSRDSNGDSGL